MGEFGPWQGCSEAECKDAPPGFEPAIPNFGAITNTLNEGRTFRLGLQLGW